MGEPVPRRGAERRPVRSHVAVEPDQTADQGERPRDVFTQAAEQAADTRADAAVLGRADGLLGRREGSRSGSTPGGERHRRDAVEGGRRHCVGPAHGVVDTLHCGLHGPGVSGQPIGPGLQAGDLGAPCRPRCVKAPNAPGPLVGAAARRSSTRRTCSRRSTSSDRSGAPWPAPAVPAGRRLQRIGVATAGRPGLSKSRPRRCRTTGAARCRTRGRHSQPARTTPARWPSPRTRRRADTPTPPAVARRRPGRRRSCVPRPGRPTGPRRRAGRPAPARLCSTCRSPGRHGGHRQPVGDVRSRRPPPRPRRRALPQ